MHSTRSRSLKDEDRACSLVVDICGESVQLLLVADGHGGKEVAELCAEVALEYLVEEATASGNASAASLSAASARTYERLHAAAVARSKTAGATLTIAAWNAARGELTIANAGDSAALLVEAEDAGLLTAEHRLQNSAEERQRVHALGFKLAQAMTSVGVPGGPVRVWPGGLAVCRTIGDADCGAVSSVPSVRTVSRDPSIGAALIVCSDGVWDALSNDKVASYVRDCVTATEAADRVVSKAAKARGLRDDITSAVAWLGTPAWVATVHERRASGLGGLFRRMSHSPTSQRQYSPSGSSSNSSTPPVSSPASPNITPAPSMLDLELAAHALDSHIAHSSPNGQRSGSRTVFKVEM
jgi:serine/threonine protein phosphatase PrpC